jgi:hypothetical protein
MKIYCDTGLTKLRSPMQKSSPRDAVTSAHHAKESPQGDQPPRSPRIAIIGREELLERSVQSCLESLGVCLLCEWDVLAFVYRHGASLASADQIARLIGYESTVVGDALERLERDKLIERSRSSQGAHLCRVPPSTDAERWRCLQELLSLSETRAGRLLLARLLTPVRTRAGQEEQSTESRK